MGAQATNEWMVVFTGIIAIATIVMIVSTSMANARSHAANERLNWLTGAMERHSDQQRQLAAMERGMKLIWWDPTIAPWPFDGEHGQPIKADEMYIGIPTDHRQGNKKKTV